MYRHYVYNPNCPGEGSGCICRQQYTILRKEENGDYREIPPRTDQVEISQQWANEMEKSTGLSHYVGMSEY